MCIRVAALVGALRRCRSQCSGGSQPQRGRAVALGALLLVGLGPGCRPSPSSASGPEARRELNVGTSALAPWQQAAIARARQQVAAAPGDGAARVELGMALMEATLAGALHYQTQAELHLERAFELRPGDAELQRALGRFYNLRAVEYDFSKAERQSRVYDALLGGLEPGEMSVSQFVAHSFRRLAEIIHAADRGRMFTALLALRELEAELAAKNEQHADDIELAALAGNFELFFAGFVPVGRVARIRRGIAYFTKVRERWDEMRPGIRASPHCPNTRENFMFELAEAHLALGERAAASELYAEMACSSPPATRGKALIAEAAKYRLAHLDEYAHDLELMPPWPSDGGNCIVCHAWTGDVPLSSFHAHGTIDFAAAVDGRSWSARPAPMLTRNPRPEMKLAPELRASLDRHCAPCHLRGGEAVATLDLANPMIVRQHANVLLESMQAGRMPPRSGEWADHDRVSLEQLTHWLRALSETGPGSKSHEL